MYSFIPITVQTCCPRFNIKFDLYVELFEIVLGDAM